MGQLRDDGHGNQDEHSKVAKVRREQTDGRRMHLGGQQGRVGHVQVQRSPAGGGQLCGGRQRTLIRLDI